MRRRESCGSAKQGGTTGQRNGRGPGDCMEFGEIRHRCVLMKTSGMAGHSRWGATQSY